MFRKDILDIIDKDNSSSNKTITKGFEQNYYNIEKTSLKDVEVELSRLLDGAYTFLKKSKIDIKSLDKHTIEKASLTFYKTNSEAIVLTRTINNNLTKLLTDRFGFNIKVTSNALLNSGVDVVKPFLNNNLIELIKKTNVTKLNEKLVNVSDKQKVKVLDSLIKDVKESFHTGFEIDFNKFKVNKLDNTTIFIKINAIQLIKADLTVKEVLSLIVNEIVKFVIELENLTKKNALTNKLIDDLHNFIDNKTRDKSKLTILISKDGNKDNTNNTLFINYINKYTKGYINNKEEIENTKFRVNKFLNKFKLDIDYNNAILKLDKTYVGKPINVIDNLNFISSFSITYVIVSLLFLIMSLSVSVIGTILSGVTYTITKESLFGVTSMVIKNLINARIKTDPVADYIVRLKEIKSNIIKSFNYDLTSDEINIINSNLHTINTILDKYKHNIKYYKLTEVGPEEIDKVNALITNDTIEIYNRMKI